MCIFKVKASPKRACQRRTQIAISSTRRGHDHGEWHRRRRTATPEEIAYSDEMVRFVQFALRGAVPADREAFILHALEGFSAEEIASITDRKLEQVAPRNWPRTRTTAPRVSINKSDHPKNDPSNWDTIVRGVA